MRRSRVLEAVVHARGHGADVFSSYSRANQQASRAFTSSPPGRRCDSQLGTVGRLACALDDSYSFTGREPLGTLTFRGTPALTPPCI